MPDRIQMDWQREARIGLDEAIYCPGKQPEQLLDILQQAAHGDRRLLLTRLDDVAWQALPEAWQQRLDHDPVSQTAVLGALPALAAGDAPVAILTGGAGDLPAAAEAQRTLAYYGVAARAYADIGVAGLWRVMAVADELRNYRVVIVVAGMEGALFSVVAGLTPAAVIAVPMDSGYGVAEGGRTALHSALASCAPGVVTVNVGNGYGAACAAMRIFNAAGQA